MRVVLCVPQQALFLGCRVVMGDNGYTRPRAQARHPRARVAACLALAVRRAHRHQSHLALGLHRVEREREDCVSSHDPELDRGVRLARYRLAKLEPAGRDQLVRHVRDVHLQRKPVKAEQRGKHVEDDRCRSGTSMRAGGVRQANVCEGDEAPRIIPIKPLLRG
eukprot:6181738-Pleurochrysis_carterae.AAC.2